MVKICGAKNVTRLTHEGALANECFLDVLSVVSHVLFFICAIPILIALTKLQVLTALWNKPEGSGVIWFHHHHYHYLENACNNSIKFAMVNDVCWWSSEWVRFWSRLLIFLFLAQFLLCEIETWQIIAPTQQGWWSLFGSPRSWRNKPF